MLQQDDDVEMFLRNVDEILPNSPMNDLILPGLLEKDGHQHQQIRAEIGFQRWMWIWTTVHYISLCLWGILLVGYVHAIVWSALA